MRKLKKHISISLDVECIITEYANKCNISFSEAVTQLVTAGNNNIKLSRMLDKNNALLDKLYSKSYYSTQLLEQFYSDLEIYRLTNPNANKALNKFKKKFSKYDYDD